jgi:hypothetical protein
MLPAGPQTTNCPSAMIMVLVLVLVLAMMMMMMMLIDSLVMSLPPPPDAHRLRQKSILRSAGPFSRNSTPAMALGNACYGILLTCTDSSL